MPSNRWQGGFCALIESRAASSVRRSLLEQDRARREEVASRVALAEQKALRERVRAATGDLLERIDSGEPLSSECRDRARTADRELRDWVRGRRLLDPEVARCVRAAREAGLTVHLLDDSAGRAGIDLLRVRAMVREAIEELPAGGELTARLLPEGREHALTIMVSSPAGQNSCNWTLEQVAAPSLGEEIALTAVGSVRVEPELEERHV